jgi:hypothetical protein
MPIDPTVRVANWDAGYDTTRIKAKVDVKRAGMLSRVASKFPMQTSIEASVKQTLDAIGVPTIQYAFYIAFGKQLQSLRDKEISGESMAQEVQVLIDKWVARGLAKSTLEAIRTEVFDIGSPVAPVG